MHKNNLISNKLVCILSALLLVLCMMPIVPASATSSDSNNEGSDGVVTVLGNVYDEVDEAPDLSYSEVVENEVIVVYKDDPIDLTEIDDNIEEVEVVSQEELIPPDSVLDAMDVVKLSDDTTVEDAIVELSKDPNVAAVEPNYIFRTEATTTNDPNLSSQYYLDRAGFLEAWDVTKCDEKITVAVIDDGCDFSHNDLKANVDTANAYNVVTESTLKSTDRFTYHGTAVAGIIGATANNGTRIAGTAYNAKVLPIHIFESANSAGTDKVIKAFNYIINLIRSNKVTNLKVINASVGTYVADGYNGLLKNVIKTLRDDYGVLTVAAGGNGDDNGNPITVKHYPSDFDECLAVTSLDRTGANSSWSDYNSFKDISTYGEGIATLTPNNGYTQGFNGTSAASPVVAGAAALIYSINPDFTPSQVEGFLLSTTNRVTGNYHPESGAKGSMNANAAVRKAAGLDFPASDNVSPITVYRLYDPRTGEHLYTYDVVERRHLISVGWNDEGVAWIAPSFGDPVYRVYNPRTGEHHYTRDAHEQYVLTSGEWNDEGICWYSDKYQGGKLYRLYNPREWNERASHLHTTDAHEVDVLVNERGWRYEGISWYSMN